ncbi:GGDEF domain-containing protein [Wukongibacter baidiensis]
MALTIVFIISMFLKFDNKSYDSAIVIIFITGLCSYFVLLKPDIIPLYLLSDRNQIFISMYIIAVNLGLIKYRKFPNKSFFLANTLLLISTGLNFFEDNNYGITLSIVIRFFAYLTFYRYIHSETYNEIMSKLKEASKLKQKIDRSVNKEVKKQLLHYEIAKEKLLIKSKTDSLTKAYNKEAIINIIDEMINSKENDKFSVMMFDIDNFKHINDTFGHITGDVCIKNLVNTARSSIRERDLLGRFGGDEFVIVLPGLDIEEASVVAERLRENVSSMKNPKFTISIGISSYPQDGNTVKDLISLADNGLYVSKEKGKNMVSHTKLI